MSNQIEDLKKQIQKLNEWSIPDDAAAGFALARYRTFCGTALTSLDRIKDSYQNEIDAVKRSFQNEIDELNQVHRSTLDAMKETHGEENADLIMSDIANQEQINDLKTQVSNLEKENERLQQENRELDAERQQQLVEQLSISGPRRAPLPETPRLVPPVETPTRPAARAAETDEPGGLDVPRRRSSRPVSHSRRKSAEMASTPATRERRKRPRATEGSPGPAGRSEAAGEALGEQPQPGDKPTAQDFTAYSASLSDEDIARDPRTDDVVQKIEFPTYWNARLDSFFNSNMNMKVTWTSAKWEDHFDSIASGRMTAPPTDPPDCVFSAVNKVKARLDENCYFRELCPSCFQPTNRDKICVYLQYAPGAKDPLQNRDYRGKVIKRLVGDELEPRVNENGKRWVLGLRPAKISREPTND